MFKKKVGSDACLVLTGVVNLTNGVITLDQKFTIDDLRKALQTQVVAVNATVVEVSGASVNGIVVSVGSDGFRMLSVHTDGIPFSAVFTCSAVDEIWSASLS